MRFLLQEPHEDSALVLTLLLELEGHVVQTTTCEAETLDRATNDFHAILVALSPYEALDTLLSTLRAKNICCPIVLMVTSSPAIRRAESEGLHWILKPFKIEELLEKLLDLSKGT